MHHDHLQYLLKENHSLRLLRLDNAPLLLSFFFLIFKKQNLNSIAAGELKTQLSDYLYQLRQMHGEEIYPGAARTYLETWTNEGFLRQYYPEHGDEPIFELTPATEKALYWIQDLEKREFVGTESRLLKIFELLQEIVFESSEDPQKRLKALETQKAELENQITKLKAGQLSKMDATKIKERFLEAEESSRRLLSDFRQIEQNFRSLDRQAREKQFSQGLHKGQVLEDVFAAQDLIWDTDQGRSFKAFWEFLMSQEKQEELSLLLKSTLELPEIQGLKQSGLLDRLKLNLIEAGDKVNRSTHQLIAQLRKYLEDQAQLENKRILEIIEEIKTLGLSLKEKAPSGRSFFQLEDKPRLEFVMERPWFSPPQVPQLPETLFETGLSQANLEILHRQFYIDPQTLRQNIRQLLRRHVQVSLSQIVAAFPTEKGLAEVLGYFYLASKDNKAHMNEAVEENLPVSNREKQKNFSLKVPQVIFCR